MFHPAQCLPIPILHPCLNVLKAQQRGHRHHKDVSWAEQGTLEQKGLDGCGTACGDLGTARAEEAWGKVLRFALADLGEESSTLQCLPAYLSNADKSSAGRRTERNNTTADLD